MVIMGSIATAHRHLKNLRAKAIKAHRKLGRGKKAPQLEFAGTTFAVAAFRIGRALPVTTSNDGSMRSDARRSWITTIWLRIASHRAAHEKYLYDRLPRVC